MCLSGNGTRSVRRSGKYRSIRRMKNFGKSNRKFWSNGTRPVSSNNRQVGHENAQFNDEEATEGLLSFDHSDEQQYVSIGSVEKETIDHTEP